MARFQATSAFVWSALDLLLRQGVQLVFVVVLARLVSVEEFGTFAILSLFAGMATAFSEGGLSNALIQNQETTHRDENAAFWLNIGTGLVGGLLLLLSGPFLSAYYRLPRLSGLSALLGLNVLIASMSVVPIALLTKRLQFRRQAFLGGVSAVAGGCVGVWMALANYGVWSLAAQTLAATSTLTALVWVTSSWRPAFSFDVPVARRLIRFGGFLMLSSILEIIYARLSLMMIGKLFGAVGVGYYSRADSTKQLPIGVIGGAISRVTLPLLSGANLEPSVFRATAQTAIRTGTLVAAPLMLGLAAVAPGVVTVLFGEQWAPAVPYLRILCLGGVLWPASAINLNILIARGQSVRFFRLEVVKKIVGIALLLAVAPLGPLALAWMTTLFGLVALGINARHSRELVGYGFLAQLRDIAPLLGVALVMALAVVMFSYLASVPLLVLLMLQVVVGGLVYGLGLVVIRQVDVMWVLRFTFRPKRTE